MVVTDLNTGWSATLNPSRLGGRSGRDVSCPKGRNVAEMGLVGWAYELPYIQTETREWLSFKPRNITGAGFRALNVAYLKSLPCLPTFVRKGFDAGFLSFRHKVVMPGI